MCNQQVDDELCEAMGRMRGLTHLDLRQPSPISGRGLDRLAGLERLRTLRLGPCAGLLDSSFQSIACHTQLTELDICFGEKGRTCTSLPAGKWWQKSHS